MPSDCLLISYARRRLPQMSTFSISPPALRMTPRNLSILGATVRSSIPGSRITMSSYGCITDPPPSDFTATGFLWQEGVCASCLSLQQSATQTDNLYSLPPFRPTPPWIRLRARSRPESCHDVSMRIALISLHTSPAAVPGSGDAGGMNVVVSEAAAALAARGHDVVMVTRATG